MSQDDLAERLDAVERRLDAAYPDAAADGTTEQATDRIETFAERLADLEAAVEAVEGYVGEIERVDAELEQRADAALATADGLESRVEHLEARVGGDGSDLEERLAEQDAALAALRNEVEGLEDRIGERQADGDKSAAGDPLDEFAAVGAGDAPVDPTDDGTGQVYAGTRRDASSEREPDRVADSPGQCTCSDAPAGPPSAADSPPTAAARHSAPDGGVAISSRSEDPLDRRNASTESIEGAADQPPGTPGLGTTNSPASPEATGSSSPGDSTSREPGRRSHRASSSQSSVSGWGELGSGVDEPDADRSRSGDGRGTAEEDPGLADANTETLLDRLRSLL
ncbi:hypothetical protein L593_10435 [Salinarchaeum sp. Harcht-Bsk1]|uniref:DUF7310 family coiled-coil domain-containing protein n=1 Tax=Salinarchaeum sp. Harcht-Bsk1 TaxID=1333523 RepID=UPI0003422FC5|nr:hypothetical protein [Salinarchaeum sp. Harcht-Bsk1]AGN02032.1 hypothetical protein L593_10435 [Salinarchaeum sp. Harcht-Bsk1]